MGACADLVQRMATAGLEGRWEDFTACVTEDVTAWSPSYDVQGRDAWVATIQAQNEPFDDIRQDLEVVAETDSVVVIEWRFSVPHPAGEGRFELRGLSVFECEGGLIARIRQYFDTGALAAG